MDHVETIQVLGNFLTKRQEHIVQYQHNFMMFF